MRRLMVLVAIVAIAVSLGRGVASAQGGAPIVPAPNQCTVTPRPIEFFQQLAGMEGAATPAPVDMATPDTFEMPEGEPADRQTRLGVFDTIRQMIACVNAGNHLGAAALFSEGYFAHLVAAEGPPSEEELAGLAAEPTPLPADGRVAILAIVEVRVLPDGRAAILIDLDDPTAETPGPRRVLFFLVQEEGRWLIEAEIEVGPIDPAQAGTPTA